MKQGSPNRTALDDNRRKSLECVPDAYAEGERTVITDFAVTEHQSRTEVHGEAEREIEGIFKSHVANYADIDHVFPSSVLPNGDAGSWAAIESPASGRSPVRLSYHKVVDTVHVEGIGAEAVVKTKLELEEMRTPENVVLITDIDAVVAYPSTERLRLCICKSSETKGCYNDEQCFFHNSLFLAFPNYTSPENPMNAIARMPQVIRAIGTPLNCFGTSLSSRCSRNPAKMIRAIP